MSPYEIKTIATSPSDDNRAGGWADCIKKCCDREHEKIAIKMLHYASITFKLQYFLIWCFSYLLEADIEIETLIYKHIIFSNIFYRVFNLFLSRNGDFFGKNSNITL